MNALIFGIGFAIFLIGGVLTVIGAGIVPPAPFDLYSVLAGVGSMIAGCVMLEMSSHESEEHDEH